MHPDRWRRVNDVFQDAIARGAAERSVFLVEACSGDEGLREEVERLVRAHERATGFLESPAFANANSGLSFGQPLTTVVREFSAYQVGADFQGTERFTVLRRLGGGGMGVVYEVRDRIRNEVIALKTLIRASAADIYRLKREFRTMADVAHPNVVCLYELIVEPEQCFFTMELVSGVNSSQYVRNAPAGTSATDRSAQRLDVDRMRSVLRQLVAGLSALHAKGKLHRDIKPSNIMVTPEGRVVILDFGLMSDVRLDTDEAAERMAGTPPYLAPEQHHGTLPSEASDW